MPVSLPVSTDAPHDKERRALQTAMGLPVVHTWGGVVADGVTARHRS
jgi:hypothetical protein